MAKSKKDTKPVIESFGIQSETDRTLYTTWRWNGGVIEGKDRTDHYRVLWEYTTGNKDSSGSVIWFTGSDSTTTKEQSTYNAPSNAKKVRVRVKAIAKKHTVNKTEVAWFTTTGWSTINGTVKAVMKITDPIVIGQPSAPTVTIENYILTASLSNISSDINADQIVFEVIQDDSVDFNTIPAEIVTSSASVSCNVEAGHNYKVRCVAYNSVEDDQGEWSDYSSNVGTIPVGPDGFASIEAASETSVKLTWVAITNATGYDIEYTSDITYFDTSSQTQTLSIDGGGSTIGIVTGLETGQEWFFRLRAKNDSGDSTWSRISSIAVGKDPAAPTTWSSSTTCTAGEKVTLYWVHNAEDNSPQTSAEIEIKLSVNGSVISTDTIPVTTSDEDATKTYSYEYDTTSLTENTNISWRVRTAGITGNYSEWSTVREINVYAPPTLVLEVTDQNGTAVDTVTEYPIRVKGTPGPASQKAVSMYLEVVANESYTTIDNIGNEQLVKKGEKIYSTVVDRPSTTYGCIFWLYPSTINLDNNISYTVNCLVSMDTGLTAEASKSFDVAWTETEYSPTAEIGINKDDISAYIRPYVEGEEDVSILIHDDASELKQKYMWISLSKDPLNNNNNLPYAMNAGCAVIYEGELHILGGSGGWDTSTNCRKYHYKWDKNTNTWSKVSTLPYEFHYGAAVVWQNPYEDKPKIHIFGSACDGILSGSGNYMKCHYAWDGESWTEISTLPHEFCYGQAVVWNGYIWLIGGYNDVATSSTNAKQYHNKFYRLDYFYSYSYAWIEYPDMPITWYPRGAVVYNDTIHVFGQTSDSIQAHIVWNSSENQWDVIGDLKTTMGFDVDQELVTVHDNKIHLMAGFYYDDNGDPQYSDRHYAWDGTTWTEVSTLPFIGFATGCAISYDDELYIMGGYYNQDTRTKQYRYHKVQYLQNNPSYWKKVTVDTSVDYMFDVCEFKGKYLACGRTQDYDNECVWISYDLISWSMLYEDPSDRRADPERMKICASEDIVVFGGKYFYYSMDGVTWNQGTGSMGSYIVLDMIYANNMFVACGEQETIRYSYDGITWNTPTIEGCEDSKADYYKIIYFNNCFMAMANSSTMTHTSYSYDGITWTHFGEGDMPVDVRTITIIKDSLVGYNIYLVNGMYQAHFYESADGINWTLLSTVEIGRIKCTWPSSICYIDTFGIYVIAIGYGAQFEYTSRTVMLYSEDLIKWTIPYSILDTEESWKYLLTLKYFSNAKKLLFTHYYDYPFFEDLSIPYPPLTLSVYRREFDGDFTEIATGIKNGSNTYVIDPHPALDFARYRIVAIDNETGAVSYNDPPGYPVEEKAIIIQWDEKWSNFDVDPDNEDALTNPPWTGSLLKLPYNVDVADSNETDVSLVEYIGRKHPVSYYGTQRGETASWSVDIPKSDKDTLYALRRLRVYMGDAYVREPSGSGYWARIKVSFSQTHCETVIPVSIDITRVEGGK